MKRADQVTTAAIVLITVLYLGVASGYQSSARIVPMMVGGVTLLVALVQLLAPRIPVFRPFVGEFDAEEDAAVFRDPRLRRRLVVVCASLLVVVVLVYFLGLVVSLPLYVALFMGLVDRQHPLVVLGGTLLIATASYGLLVGMLGMPWDDGRLWSML